MNKKLLAVAVAGALSAPVVAFAQSSVTISGNIKMSMQQYKLSNASAARAGQNTSQSLVHDDSSRIIFNMTEDLGAGLQAIAQIDWRIVPDLHVNAAGIPQDNIGGNSHVGLRSKAWGRIFFGSQDVHYFGRESDLTVKNDLQSDSISLLAFVAGAGVANGGIPIAGATRTRNIVHYTTPNWGGFTGVVAYSFNPTAQEQDIGTAGRKGYAWNVAPTFEGRNFTIGYSYWTQKADLGAGAATGAFVNQRGDRLFGSYRWGGFKIGAAWDKSKVTNEGVINAVTGSTTAARRDAWSIPVEYTWGPHWIGGHYTKANNDKATAVQDGAKMWAIGYNYSLSKRTSVGVTYAAITNDTGATYTPFTGNGALGSTTHTPFAGEDPRFWSMTIRHAF
jgi:predicted porin